MFSDSFVFSHQTNINPASTYITNVIWFSKSAKRDILGIGVSCSPEKTFEYFSPKKMMSLNN